MHSVSNGIDRWTKTTNVDQKFQLTDGWWKKVSNDPVTAIVNFSDLIPNYIKRESLYATKEDAHIAFNEAVEKYIREQYK